MDDAVELGEVDNRRGPSGADAMRVGATPDATASNPAAANVREIHIALLLEANAISSQPSADSYATQVHFSSNPQNPRTSNPWNLEPRASRTLEPLEPRARAPSPYLPQHPPGLRRRRIHHQSALRFRARPFRVPVFRYASASATCAGAVSALQMEIFSASTASPALPPRR